MELELKEDFDGNVMEDFHVSRAKSLVNYALTLRERYIDWPIDLLDPNKNEYLVSDVNVIFSYALSYIYFHEYAHIKFRHSSRIGNDGKIEQEIEADNFALSVVLGPLESDKKKRDYGIGVACAGIAMLYSVSQFKKIKQKTHPDVDIRLANSMSYI
jgi:hypothetical protein